MPILILLLIATFQVRWMGWYQWVAAVASAVAGFLIIYLTCFLIHNFTAGALGTIIAIFFSTHIWRIKLTLFIAATLTYIVWFELVLFGSDAVSIGEQALFSFFVLLSGFGAMFGVYVNELQLRTKFLQQEIIDAQHLEQLVHTEKLATLGTVIAGVVHEINNPNNAIMLDARTQTRIWSKAVPALDEHIEAEEFDIDGYSWREVKDEVTSSSERIARNAERIMRTVENLRAFAKKDAIELNADLDINTVTSSAIGVIDHLIRTKTMAFRVEFGKGLPLVRGNSHYLEQVIINIVKNACQALPSAEKAIVVSTSHNVATKSVVVAVKDEGCGMDEETRKSIFSPFFSTKGKDGTGLGLSICNNIVKNHGGKIDVESKVGQGTTIRVMLPIAAHS
jgi:polar amino acid transport system substrate-binding protein